MADKACPACKEKRVHTQEEWAMYHPGSGSGHDLRHLQPVKKKEAKEK